MHVVILNQTFYPDVAATAQHMWDLARHLQRAGHRVTAVTSQTIYGSTERFEKKHEIVEGIEIFRVRQTAFGKKNILGRLIDFASFYVTAFLRLARVGCPDVIYGLTSPPMISVLAQVVRSFRLSPSRKRVAFVHHLMDLYPDAAVAMKVAKPRALTTRITGWFTKRMLKHADAIIVLGDDMKRRIVVRYGVSDADPKVHVVTPWADAQELFPISANENPLRSELQIDQTFNIVYSGNLGMAHDVETMARAIERTQGIHDLKWIFIGSGKRFDLIKARASERGLKNVTFHGYQDRSKLNASLNLADVHLISQLPEFTGIVVPSKLFGIMAVGKPSIMIGPEDAAVSEIILKNHAGFVVPIGDVDRLIGAIERLRSDPDLRARLGSNARAAFERDHSSLICCERIHQILKNAVGNQ